jgi:hypothetical protein
MEGTGDLSPTIDDNAGIQRTPSPVACFREVRIARSDATGFALRALEEAYRQKNEDDVECGLYVGFRFGFTPEFLDVLTRLSEAEWHHSHEDVVAALDGLDDTRTIEALYRAALKIHAYVEYDDSRALAGKAIWALGKLGDATADQKLRLLAESGDSVIGAYARKQLYRRSGRVTPEERERGYALCERIDKEKDQTIRTQLLRQLKEFNEQQHAVEQSWAAEQGWGNSSAKETDVTSSHFGR